MPYFIGQIISFPRDKLIKDFLFCNGMEFSADQYMALAFILPNGYSVNKNKNTYRLPDLNGRMPVGGIPKSSPYDGTISYASSAGVLPQHTHKAEIGFSAEHAKYNSPARIFDPCLGSTVFNMGGGAKIYHSENGLGEKGKMVNSSKYNIRMDEPTDYHHVYLKRYTPFIDQNFMIAVEGIFPQRS